MSLIDRLNARRLHLRLGASAAPAQTLRAQLQQARHAPAQLSVSLPAQCCKLAVLPWSEALLRADSAQTYARMHMLAVFGESAQGWIISIDDAAYGQPRLACAIERELSEALHQVAAECGHTLVALESSLSEAWRALGPRKPRALAVVEAGRLVLAAGERGRIVAVQSQPLRGAWHSELAQAWQRWTLRAPDLAGITHVRVVQLDPLAVAASLPALFALTEVAPAPTPSTGFRGWRLAAFLLGALALLAAALVLVLQLRVTGKLEADLANARPQVTERAPVPAAQQRQQEQQLKAIQDAVRQLNVPVGGLLKQVQAPADIHVALLGLDLNGALKISAEAQALPDMLNYVAFLNEQALFSTVYLVKHEQADHGVRFLLEAQWKD